MILLTRVVWLGVLLFSIAACFGDAHKLFELTSHFRLQYFVASLACSLIFLYFRAWPWAVAGLVCVAINGATLAPWYGRGTQVDPGQPVHDLRLLLANVHYANSQYSSLIQLVREEQPDLLIVEELTDQWLEGLKPLSQMFPYDTLWSPYYTRFEQETGMVNARKGFGLFPTWPTWMQMSLLMIPIDHCLVSSDLRVTNFRTGRNVGSDHLPVIVDIAF